MKEMKCGLRNSTTLTAPTLFESPFQVVSLRDHEIVMQDLYNAMSAASMEFGPAVFACTYFETTIAVQSRPGVRKYGVINVLRNPGPDLLQWTSDRKRFPAVKPKGDASVPYIDQLERAARNVFECCVKMGVLLVSDFDSKPANFLIDPNTLQVYKIDYDSLLYANMKGRPSVGDWKIHTLLNILLVLVHIRIYFPPWASEHFAAALRATVFELALEAYTDIRRFESSSTPGLFPGLWLLRIQPASNNETAVNLRRGNAGFARNYQSIANHYFFVTPEFVDAQITLSACAHISVKRASKKALQTTFVRPCQTACRSFTPATLPPTRAC